MVGCVSFTFLLRKCVLKVVQYITICIIIRVTLDICSIRLIQKFYKSNPNFLRNNCKTNLKSTKNLPVYIRTLKGKYIEKNDLLRIKIHNCFSTNFDISTSKGYDLYAQNNWSNFIVDCAHQVPQTILILTHCIVTKTTYTFFYILYKSLYPLALQSDCVPF